MGVVESDLGLCTHWVATQSGRWQCVLTVSGFEGLSAEIIKSEVSLSCLFQCVPFGIYIFVLTRSPVDPTFSSCTS